MLPEVAGLARRFVATDAGSPGALRQPTLAACASPRCCLSVDDADIQRGRPPPALHQQGDRPRRLAAQQSGTRCARRRRSLAAAAARAGPRRGGASSSHCYEAIAGPRRSALAFCRERLAWPPERLNPPPLVDGADLIRHGLAPGPQFSALLEQVRDAQLNGEIASRDEALALADRLRKDAPGARRYHRALTITRPLHRKESPPMTRTVASLRPTMPCRGSTACIGCCSSRASCTSSARSFWSAACFICARRLARRRTARHCSGRSAIRRPPRRLGQVGRHRHAAVARHRPVELSANHQAARTAGFVVPHDRRPQDARRHRAVLPRRALGRPHRRRGNAPPESGECGSACA